MKILPIDKVREGDAYTIKNEPVESVNLMERAANACASWIESHIVNSRKINIFCGLGNNGGDGLAVGRLLHQKNYSISIFVMRLSDKVSDDFRINFERLRNIPDIEVTDLKENGILPEIGSNDIIIDALFGSGLTKPVKGFAADVINHINSSKAYVISIDVPSGLFCDSSSEITGCVIIKANQTLTFQLPRFAFLFAENEKYVGSWEVLQIGISKEFIDKTEVKSFLTVADDIRKVYKPRQKFAHKGNHGHALLISGSYGKMGAAVLGSASCLRSGVGLLTVHIPACGYTIIQTTIPEAMVFVDKSEKCFSGSGDISKYNAVAIGPGIGTDKSTQSALKDLMNKTSVPLIFDADAINILGENKEWLSLVPKNSIFTPHHKEFERLTTKADNDFHRNQLQREFSVKHGVYVVLKGAFTAISTPEGNCYFNSSGNPGMATAGSGDVLTGIILSLKAQNYSSFDACLMGVYIHGLAGDLAAEELGHEAMIAGDITGNLGKAFKRF